MENNLKRGNKILHIVPTFILFMRRKNFYQKFLNISLTDLNDHETSKELQKHNIYLFEFNRFLEFLTKESGLYVLSRNESLVILERVMKENKHTANYAWRSILHDLHQIFYEFTLSGIEINQLKAISYTKSWKELIELYSLYKAEINKNYLYDYASAINIIIKNGLNLNFDHVILDGAFLPIRPVLNTLIDYFEKSNVNVSFFIPFDMDYQNSAAFRVLRKTYEPYVPFEKWISIKQEKRNQRTVEKLARNVFTKQTDQIVDDSLEIINYTTKEIEMEDVVNKVLNLVKDRKTSLKKIAIVSPNSKSLRPIINEYAELQGQVIEKDERPLVQLPFGKFIYLIYLIFIDEKINVFGNRDHYIDANIVTDLLDTKVVKRSNKIIPIYEKIKVFFEDCTTFEEWYEQVDQLREAKTEINASFEYHPLYYINKEDLDLFKNYLNYIEQLARRLITVTNMTFNKHLNYLLDLLDTEEKIEEPEDEVILRILEIREKFDFIEGINIAALEFARRIYSIFTDTNQEKQSNLIDITFQTDQEMLDNQDKIMVTGLNNVEYQEYDYLFLVQFTQNMYPYFEKKNWPYTEEVQYQLLNKSTKLNFSDVEEYRKYLIDRFIYQIFVVVNSTRKKLTITYSNVIDGIKQTPSHYLYDFAKVFGIEESNEQNENIEELLIKHGLLFRNKPKEDTKKELKIEQKEEKINQNSTITIEKLAIYEYCPRRFLYEMKYPELKVYDQIFEIQLYATACLYEEAIKLFVEQFPIINLNNYKKIIHTIESITIEAAKKIKKMFPIGERYWEDIKKRTIFHIENLIDRILKVTDHKRAELSLSDGQYVTKNVGGFTFKGKRELRVKYPTITHYYSISNLKELLIFSFSSNDAADYQFFEHVKKHYLQLLSDFCYERDHVEITLQRYVRKFNERHYAKNPGLYCKICPFSKHCMESGIV